ncbi:MAG: hypothetical protein V4669_13585 [Pseudomonadota bacterium]
MALAGTLEVQLMADVARIKADMEQAKGIVSSGARAMESAADSARRALGGIGAGLSVAAFAGWIKGAIDAADSMNDLSKSTDIAVGKLAGLKMAAKQSGGDLDSVAKSINKLQLEIGKDADKFAKIGITAKDGLGAFKQLSDVFKEIRDPQLRAAVAAEALGKSWAGAAPLLSEGSKKIQEMVDKGELLSGMNQASATASDDFNDRLVELQTALGGTALILANQVLPLLTALAEDLTTSASDVNGLDSSFSPLTETLRAVIILLGNVGFVLKGVGTEIGVLAAQADALGIGFTEMLNPAAAAARAVTIGAEGWRKFNTIGKEARESAAWARADFDAWEKKMLDVGKATKVVTKETTDVVSAMDKKREALLREFVAQENAKKAAAALAKELAEQAKLLAELSGLSGSFYEDWNRLNTMFKAGKITLVELTKAQADLLAQQPRMKKDADEKARAMKAAGEAARDLMNALEEVGLQESRDHDERTRIALAINEQSRALADANAEMKMEASLLNASDRQRAIAIGNLRIDIELRKKLEELNKSLAYTGNDEATIKRLAAERALRQTQLERNAETEKAMLAEAMAMRDQITIMGQVQEAGKQLWDTLWEGGSDTFKRLGQALKRFLLDVLFEMTAKKWLISIGASLTAGGATAGTSIAGSVANMLGGSNPLSMLGNLFGSGGFPGADAFTLSGAANALGFGNFAAGLSGVGGSFASSIGMGLATDAMGATVIADAAAATIGSVGTMAGSALASIASIAGPLAIGALLITQLLKGHGETRSGGQYVNGTFIGGPSGGQIGADGVSQAIGATMISINETLRALGSSSTLAKLVSGLEASEKGKGFAYAGGALNTGAVFGQGIDGQGYENRRGNMTPEQAATAFQAELEQATLQALQAATDIPESIAKQLRGVDVDSLADEARKALLSSINASILSVQQFGEALKVLPFDQLRGLTFDLTSTFIDASGGLQQALGNLTGFVENFYSDTEKRQLTAENISKAFATVGLNYSAEGILGGSRKGFRELAEAIDVTTEEGARTYAVFMSMQGAFAELHPIAETVTGDVAAIDEALKSLTAEGKSLEVQLLRAQGNGGLADTMQRLLDIDGMSEAAVAQYDRNQALKTEITRLNEVTAAAEAMNGVIKGLKEQTKTLEIELLRAMGNNDAADAMQRAWDTRDMSDAAIAVYYYNQTLRDQIELLDKAKVAAAERTALEKSFYDNFAPDNFKRGMTAQGIADTMNTSGLGIAISADEVMALSREKIGEWMIEAINAGDAGKPYVDLLLSLGEALNQVVPPFDAAEQAISDAADALERLKGEGKSLEIQLLQAQGDTTGARAMQRSLDIVGLDQAAIDQYDYNESIRDAITVLNEAAQVAQQRSSLEKQILQLEGNTTALRELELAAMEESLRPLQERIYALQDEAVAAQKVAQVAQERTSLETRLLQLQGNTAELRERELAALDPANRALLETIFGLEDLAAEAQKAAQAHEAAAAKAKAIADERAGLQQRIYQLEGNTAKLRELELAALDPSNRALQRRIYALEAEAEAAQKAAAIAQERAGLEKTLLGLQGNTAALRALELAALDPSNRALQEQIWALQDQTAAADEAARAAEALKDQWKGIADALFEEAKRTRDLLTPQSREGLAQLQAQFAVLNAQARAGSQSAASQLPGLNQSILSMAQSTGLSGIDLKRLIAQQAFSLEQTGLRLGANFGIQGPDAPVVNQLQSVNDRIATLETALVTSNTALEKIAANTEAVKASSSEAKASLKEIKDRGVFVQNVPGQTISVRTTS